jgi:tetratricopeptide (TPR) repeat protein
VTPLIFRVLAAGGWLVYAILCVFFWSDLLKIGYSIEPMEPVDATIVMILMGALFGMVLHSVVADKLVAAPTAAVRRSVKVPEGGKVTTDSKRMARAKDLTSRSSQRLAAVQARFDNPPPSDGSDDLGDLEEAMTSVRELEKNGKLQQALALANRKGEKPAAARLYMKLGQYLHALDVYVELEDYEGAAMAATLKGDTSMARAFWRQSALNLQNAGAANPNMLGGLWDRAGNPAAAAASYEAGGMLHKAMECFEVAGDTKSAERCRQKRALQTAFEETATVGVDEAKESARYLSDKGDLFGAAEALLEAKLVGEAAAYFEKCGDLNRAARYYEKAGQTELAEGLRAKLNKQDAVAAATEPSKGAMPPPIPQKSSPVIGPKTEESTPSKEELERLQAASRKRPGVIAMESAGIEVPSDIDPAAHMRDGFPSGTLPPSAGPSTSDNSADDTASRLSVKKRAPQESDLAATTVRNRPRPAGAVNPLKMSTVDLNSAATQIPASGPGSAGDPKTVEPERRAPFVPFPGELPTPSDLFLSPPPLPWKGGWPLLAPEPRSIGVPLFAASIAGESVLVHPPAFALSGAIMGEDGEGADTIRTAQQGGDSTEALMRVQTLAGEGKFREAAEVAAGIEAWAAAATLLDNGRFWSEAADLWRRLGQWKDAVTALERLARVEDAALLYLGAGRVNRCVAVLRRGMRRHPEQKEKLAAMLGRILVIMGRIDLATRMLRTVIAPSGPGMETAVAVYRFGRILEDHDALAEAHSVYVALMEAGARNEELRDREQNLARELGKARYLPPDSARIVGDVEMTAFDAMVTRVDSPLDFPTLVDGRPATFMDLNGDQALEWILRGQPEVRQRGVVRPRIMAEPFPFTLPEDLSGPSGNPKDATAARVVSSPMSLSLFGAPFAPPEPWVQQWRFTIRDVRSTLGRETLFHAEDSLLKETVALRVFSRGSYNNRGLAWVADRIRSLTALSHPNIVTVVDMGVADLRPYLVERYYPTGSLSDRLRIGGALPFAAALRIFVQVSRGLEAAGRLGLVHGHIHPGQVLFGHGGEALLSSWGVEIIRKGPDILESFPKGPSSARPDIRALGLLAYVALAGHPPAERNALPLHGVRPDIPEAFGQIVEWCVGADPKRRYHSVGEFLPAVEQLLTAV